MTENFKIGIIGARVDMTTRTITGVIIASKMKPKDSRNFVIDDNFITKYMKVAGKKQKTEINHNYSSLVGNKLGYVDNFSSDGTSIKGDLHIYESADLSPVWPGIGDYILKSVQEDPASYMLSLKVMIDKYYGNDKQGQRQELERFFSWEDGFYWRYKSTKEKHNGEVYGNPVSAHGIDVVGEGALTNSMFSDEADSEAYFMDLFEQEAFRNFMIKNREMFNIHSQPGGIQELFTKLQKFFKMDLNSQIQEKEQELEALKAQLNPPAPTPAATSTQAESHSTQPATPAPAPAPAVNAEISVLQAQITALQQEITSLKAAPAAPHAGAAGGSVVEKPTKVTPPSYLLNSVNRPLLEKWCKENGQDISNF